MPATTIADVAVGGPAVGLDQLFSYYVPRELVPELQLGSLVRVSFGPRCCQGFVCHLYTRTHVPGSYRPLQAVVGSLPLLTEELIALAGFMARTYFCTLSQAIHTMVPVAVRGKVARYLVPGPVDPEHSLLGLAAEPLIRYWQQQKKSGRMISPQKLLSLPGMDEKLLKSLVAAGILAYKDQIQSRRKTVWLTCSYTVEEWAALQKTWHRMGAKQHAILEQLVKAGGQAVSLSVLRKSLGECRQAVQRLLELGHIEETQGENILEEREGEHHPLPLLPTLTAEQAQAWSSVRAALQTGAYRALFLHGVTGSGKTEIYLRAIAEVLERGRAALFLVPEISLAPQTVARLQARFGDRVLVWHSNLPEQKRYQTWQRIRQGAAEVVVGARSAIFAPFPNLGLVVIDEEHEGTYEQEEYPAYHAIPLAHRRARYHRCVLLLGSATPSLSTYCLARRKRYQYLTLRERVQARPLPSIEIVDMRREWTGGARHMLSKTLYQALVECQQASEQALLFLNRRGFSTCLLCRQCGEAARCTACDVALTYHQVPPCLRCHYCGKKSKLPSACAHCQGTALRPLGMGTQRVETALQEMFPDLRVLRMDVDTTQEQGGADRMLAAFAAGEADVLVGTQMIAKGLDFPKLTLVGVIMADTLLHWPHFRAAERTYQLLVQVNGRSGRHKPGRAIIQTYYPDHYSIQQAAQQEQHAFYAAEIRLRRAHHYPPFCILGTVLLSHPQGDRLWEYATAWRARCEKGLPFEIWGPVAASLPKLADRYRIQLVIKAPLQTAAYRQLRDFLRSLLLARWTDSSLRARVTLEGAEVLEIIDPEGV